MKKVVVIGNGFDLDQGLTTSYADFLKNGVETPVFDTNQFLSYVKSKQEQMSPNWCDLEVALAEVLTQDLNVLDEASLDAELRRSYAQIKRLLFAFIVKEQKFFLQSKKYDKTRPSYKFLANLYTSESEQLTIYDFNYTNTVKNILADLPHRVSVEHIKVHGSIDDEEVIFGVENYADLKVPSKFVYAKKSNSPLFYTGRIADKMLSSDEVHIFGHSLGRSDEVHFAEFFQRIVKPRDSIRFPVKQSFNLYLNPDNRDQEVERFNERFDELSGSLAEFRRNVNLTYV